MKLLILSDLHIGTSRESTTHKGIVRQANSHALNMFKKQIINLICNHYLQQNLQSLEFLKS